MPTRVNINEAGATLPKLIDRVRGGEEIEIAQDDRPVARLVPIGGAESDRRPGSAEGMFVVPDDFNDPLPDDMLDEFEQ